MRITDKIISVPPYISTSWDKVMSLHMEGELLVVTLKSGVIIAIPDLHDDVVEHIFSCHIAFLESHMIEKSMKEPHGKVSRGIDQLLDSPFRLVFGSLEAISQALQHNPAYRNLPPIPIEIIEKITLLAKAVPSEDIAALPRAEENCNCIYCQMCRTLKQAAEAQHIVPDHPALDRLEEEVRSEELRFEEWDIRNIGEKLYSVTNKLHPELEYNVFLGSPVGCTCGQSNCEHIIAVLRH
jgi:hypothetical protein